MATAFASSSPPPIATFYPIFRSKSCFSLRSTTHPSLPSAISSAIFPSKKIIIFHEPTSVISRPGNRLGRIRAAPEDVLPSEAPAADTIEQVVSTTDDGVSTTISVLLFVAFIGLFILTIGVIYLAVTDFLQKREKEKFEKEEAANKSGKKKKKKKKVRARAGPRGFGQKVDEDEDDD